jgi:flagellar FliL protein
MKADPKATPAADAPAGSNKKKMMIIIIAAVLVLAGGGGGAAWFFLQAKQPSEHVKEVKKFGPPVFVSIDTFIVNLQSEGDDQFLQANLTLQVQNPDHVELIKLNMPKVRNRLLMLLSSKKPSEINTIEGKQQLAAEIIAQVNLPFNDKGPEQEVSDVMFTSFIIQ